MSGAQLVIKAKRLHPLTLVYRFLMTLPNAVLPIIFVLYSGKTGDWLYIFISLFLGLFILPGILLNYYYFDYTITEKEVIIRSGIISKKERHIKIDRIQNVSITQNFLHKILRIAKVQLETAGDSKTEGVLDSVSIKVSNYIKEIIRDQQSSSSQKQEVGIENSAYPTPPIIEEKEKIIFSMSLKDVVKYGAMRFRPLVLALSAWVFSMIQQFNPNWSNELEGILESGYTNYINQLDIFTIVLFAVLAVISILVLSWILDILLTMNTFYKFKLVETKGKFLTSQGLFSSRQGAIPLKKLQMMSIKSNPITRRLNFYRLDMQTAGFGGGDGNKAKTEIAIPFATINKLKEVINEISKVSLPEEFEKVSKKTIRRALVRYFMYALPPAIGLYFAFDSYWVLTLLIPIIIIGAYIRYQYRGYKVADNQIFVKQGFWSQKISIIPVEKIQTLHTRSTYFQRRLGLATVEIDTAATVMGGDASIIDIDIDRAEIIFDELRSLFIDAKNKQKSEKMKS